jgi:hypothetical protein
MRARRDGKEEGRSERTHVVEMGCMFLQQRISIAIQKACVLLFVVVVVALLFLLPFFFLLDILSSSWRARHDSVPQDSVHVEYTDFIYEATNAPDNEFLRSADARLRPSRPKTSQSLSSYNKADKVGGL